MLHQVREQILRRGLTGARRTEEARNLLMEIERVHDQRRADGVSESPAIELRRLVGMRRAADAKARLLGWAKSLPERAPSRAPGRSLSMAGGLALGPEPRWKCDDLRLSGGPDEAVLERDGTILLTDYKTGRVADAEGNPDEPVRVQLGLYVLMAERLSQRRVRARVVGPTPLEFTLSDASRNDLLDVVTTFGAAHPSGAELDANVSSFPGAHCRDCLIRPRCSAYLDRAPTWWPNTGGHPRPLPYDAWGRVVRASRDATGWSVVLSGAGRRNCSIQGLSDSHGISERSVGSYLYFFGLEATEDTSMHGTRRHPGTFHERAPGPRWYDASCVAVFEGPER